MSLRIAALQHDIVWEDPEANFDRLAPQIAAAVGAGAGCVVLAETFACGFSMNTDRIAEPFDGPSVGFLRAQARRHRVWIAGSVPELPAAPTSDQRPANTLVLAAPDGVVHRYRKRHPFTFAGEDRYYQAGGERVVVNVEGLRVGLFVCYDLRFADDFWALARDVDAYLVVANWPEPRREHWRVLLQARAIENQAYVVGVNRVGVGATLRYAGDSRIVGPRGELLATAAEQETILLADLDPDVVTAARDQLPFLRDRRG